MMNNYGSIPPIMNEQFRKIESNYSNSPKSSPHGGRSPIVSRQDSSGTLKATISLGKTPTIIQTGPFYALKEPPGKGELTGEKDLMTEYGLHHTLTKFKDKKLKESLSSFLPNIPGIADNADRIENSTLRSLIDKPPIGVKEILPLTPMQLAGFRLHPGPLPEHYRALYTANARKQKNKLKRQKIRNGLIPSETNLIDFAGLEPYEKKHKKQKRHEDDKERKKRKKEKKRKKKTHSPEPPSSGGVSPMLMSTNTGMVAPSSTLSGSVGLGTVVTGTSLPILPSASNASMASTASLSAIPSLTGPGSMLMPQQASLF